MTIEVFLFDMDGTLIDSEKIYVVAIRLALADRNCQVTHPESEALVYGKGWKDVYIEANERFPGVYSTSEEMEGVVHDHFVEQRGQRDIRIPGSIELLNRLSANYPVAIVSGSPRKDVEAGIQLMGVDSRLAFYLGAEDYGPGKPDPTCYRLAAERMKRLPANCLVFEDSTAGVTAAKEAGMGCIGLRRKGAPFQDLSAADAVLGDLADFNPQE